MFEIFVLKLFRVQIILNKKKKKKENMVWIPMVSTKSLLSIRKLCISYSTKVRNAVFLLSEYLTSKQNPEAKESNARVEEENIYVHRNVSEQIIISTSS